MVRLSTPRSLVITFLTLACSAAPESDDEVGVTTAMESSGESSGESSSESSTTSETDTTGTSEGFVDGFDVPGIVECDVWAQDCPVDEKCVPYANDGSSNWNDYKCVPVLGDQAPGEPCTYAGATEATDDCDATSMCFNTELIDGELIGTCYAQCTGSPLEPMCDVGSSCLLSGEGTLTLCFPLCDPLAQDCPPGEGCYWTGSEFYCVNALRNLATGQPCGFINDCAPGNLCTDASALPNCPGSACCTSYCDLLQGDADCAAQPGTACVSFFEDGTAPEGYENVGVCIVPP